jgi:Tfp pilus assembly protein PilZ
LRDKDRFTFHGVHCQMDGETHRVANLSLGGFFIAAERPVAPGQVIALSLQIGERTIPLHVKVAWVNEGPVRKQAGLPTGFGVSIKQIELRDKLAIIEVLRRASTSPRGPAGVRASGSR